jgi:monooxygenase
MEHFDILIIGAGLSGIGAGAHLRMECPGKKFAILEGRDAMGGTWDLFRYPGVRSDSDMYTLGYRFRPWTDPKAIADGPAILKYIRETSAVYDLDKEIRCDHRVRRAAWSSRESRWTVEVEIGSSGGDATVRERGDRAVEISDSRDGQEETPIPQTPDRHARSHSRFDPDDAFQIKLFTCSFLYLCTGYYDYESGYTPEWSGFENFNGTVVHPQKWPEDLDYTGKRVLVIGSGATAVTLVPAMADKATHVTMLQRSPTYVVSMPGEDRIANALRRVLPAKAAYAATRWKNVLRQMFFYQLSKKRPEFMKRLIAKGVAKEVGNEIAEQHFKPAYNPWDQRLCLVPDSDLFKAVREKKASIVTGHIAEFTESGVKLESGENIEADIIVTATGLNLKIMAGLTLIVDGETVDLSKKMAYKGMMYSDVPNLAQAFGYTNASWTLKCDLTAEYVCRLLKYMDEHGFAQCTPRLSDPTVMPEPVLDFTSGYIQRVMHELPSQGSKQPWRLHQNYIKDLRLLRHAPLEDGTMEFKPHNHAGNDGPR